jgi:hypothetical protein
MPCRLIQGALLAALLVAVCFSSARGRAERARRRSPRWCSRACSISRFLQPYDGQSSADNLLNYAAQGGFPIALENLYRTANPLVQQIADNWRTWRRGVPAH